MFRLPHTHLIALYKALCSIKAFIFFASSAFLPFSYIPHRHHAALTMWLCVLDKFAGCHNSRHVDIYRAFHCCHLCPLLRGAILFSSFSDFLYCLFSGFLNHLHINLCVCCHEVLGESFPENARCRSLQCERATLSLFLLQ